MFRNTITSRCLTVCLALVVVLPIALGGNDPAIQPRQKSGGQESRADDPGVIQGFTEPYADINMAASEMGTLATVLVKEGDVVKAGQLLANLDDAVLKASLNVAQAGMNAAGELQSANTALELKKVELQKLTELFQRNHASQQELDRISGEVRIAEARVQSVREDLDVRRLEHARIEAQLQQRQIRSTIDGVVVDIKKDCGEFVSPSDPVFARVVQLDPLLVVFSVPVARRHDVAKGQKVGMSIGAGETVASGTIEYVSPTADASSATFRVKVRLPNSDGTWHGGEKSVLLLNDHVPTYVAPKQIAKNSK